MHLSGFNTLDIVVFFGYCLLVISVALYVSGTKKGEEKHLLIISLQETLTLMGNRNLFDCR
jgi:hypothetical protein